MKLSIIVPVYNVEKYLERCVDSLVCQDIAMDDYEIILVNDGSTDGSGEICRKLQDRYSNIKFIEQENGGLSAARNTGLKHAIGQYVMFVDSDDYLLPHTINEIYEIAEKHGLDMCAYRFKTMKPDGTWYEDVIQPFDPNKIYTGEQALLHGVTISSACAIMYKTEFLQKHHLHFTTGITHEDFDFNSRAYAFAKRIMFTPKVVYCYFWNDTSLSRSQDVKKVQKGLLDELQVAANMRNFARTATVSSHIQKLYYKHSNSIIISLLLSFFRARYSYAFLQELLGQARNMSLYPIRGRSQSWATTLVIPLLNQGWGFWGFYNYSIAKTRIKLHFHVLWCNFSRWRYKERLTNIFDSHTSIICNNCFGSRISQDLRFEYLSPTVGLFMYWPDYLLFVKHLREAVHKEISFREVSKYDGKGRDYPIGSLHIGSEDIEIHFLHYHTLAEAKEKWERRCKRINMDNIVYIYEGDEDIDREEAMEFLQTPRSYFFNGVDLNIQHPHYHVIPQMRSPNFTDGYDMAHLFYQHFN